MKRIIIVGPSGAGKTSIGLKLAEELNLLFISMDDFRVKNNRRPPKVEHGGKSVRTYEDPSCWDAVPIACKMRACIQAGMGFVVEGNHLLMYPQIAAIADTERIYLDVPHAVSRARRTGRNRGTVADESFAVIGESETARVVAPQKSMPGVRVIDGTLPMAEVLAAVLQPAEVVS